MVLIYHLEEEPSSVSVDGKNATLVTEGDLNDKLEKDFKSIDWSWNDETRECWIRIPDKRYNNKIVIH